VEARNIEFGGKKNRQELLKYRGAEWRGEIRQQKREQEMDIGGEEVKN